MPERIVTDPMRLRQVLTNLVSNATKFTEAGEVAVRVDYAAARPAAGCAVEVEDTGIGIAAEQRELIFEHFVQADTSLTRRAGGTGLGLAISQAARRADGRHDRGAQRAGDGQHLQLLDPRPAGAAAPAAGRRAGAARTPDARRRCACCSPRTTPPTST